MSEFFRFPHTPHVAWLGQGQPRDDKVLEPKAVAVLLSTKLLIEEKVDGANIGFSTTQDGELQIQNRGAYLQSDRCHPQFKPLWSWLKARQDKLATALWPNLMLFGEWCYARHSIEYDNLPDWFLAFDVYDRELKRFWDSERRNTLLKSLDLTPVPELARGRFTLGELKVLLSQSHVGSQPMEGLVVRHEANGITKNRAKLVREQFTQAIEEHWSKGPIHKNQLGKGAHVWF
ncbi:MAG: RNA ligase family protein [Calditrichaeota bacterium]|nr:RNA ligase family protein [Calditrichota bacterium]